jgi:hypothetical protein
MARKVSKGDTSPATASARQDLQLRLYALAGKPEYADEFEAVRLQLAALG